MAHSYILSLPNEMVAQISEQLYPSDLEAFALSCKSIYNASQRAVTKHNGRIRRYTTLVTSLAIDRNGDGETLGERHPLFFLERLVQHPEVAYYPTELQFNGADTYDDLIEAGRAHLKEKWERTFAALGAENPWISDLIHRREWHGAYPRPPNFLYNLILLLTLLPNLKSVSMTCPPLFRGDLRDMILDIADANRDPGSPFHNKALAKLRQFTASESTEYGLELSICRAFADLPSMRFFGGTDVCWYRGDGFDEGSDEEDSKTSRMNSIEELSFCQSFIPPSDFASFVSRCSVLKSFTYHQHQSEISFTGTALVEILQRHTNGTLQKLDLTADEDVPWIRDELDPWPRDRNWLSFPNLQRLRVDDRVFQPWEKPPFPQAALDRINTKRFHPHTGALEVCREITRLVDVLPQSIRVVRLVRRIVFGDPAHMLVGLAEERAVRLPNLEEIVIEGHMVLHQKTIDNCELVGIVIRGPELQVM